MNKVTIGTQMIDITEPQYEVKVNIRRDGLVLWVNVDGICRLQVCGIKPSMLTINDQRDGGSR